MYSESCKHGSEGGLCRPTLEIRQGGTFLPYNFIASMVYTQMFNTLCDKALENGGALKTHVTCLLDEFANQKIPNFEHLISVIRIREISAHVIVQTQSQLKAVYKDHAETIIGNCSCVLFLGGKEQSTLKEISAMLGKETIDTFNTSDTRGSQRSYGLNYQKLGKEMQYLFVKSWLPNTKINGTGTRSAGNSANHVCCAFQL